MKILKKLSTLILTLCLVLPGFSLVAQAADGIVTFTDPSTKAGEIVSVSCALRSSEGSVEGLSIFLQYDPTYLKFQGGEGFREDAPGSIAYYIGGDGSNLVRFTMQFEALQPGTTSIQVTSTTARTTGGETINCTSGSSTITIAEGVVAQPEPQPEPEPEPAAVEVTVEDQKYTVAADFDSALIPEGFVEGTMEYDGTEYKSAQQEEGKLKLAYLTAEDGTGSFFLYNEKEESFAPFVQASVSAESSIVLLQKVKKVTLPEGYEKSKITVGGFDFQAWKDTVHKGYYLVYAMDQNGEKAFYQYNKSEDSYQKFAFTEMFDVQEEPKQSSNMSVFVILGGIILIALGAAVVVLTVKVRNLNKEIDDLYDEYGIEEDVIRLDEKEDTGYLDDDDDEQIDKKDKQKKEDVEDPLDDPLDDDLDFDDDDFDVDFIDLDE